MGWDNLAFVLVTPQNTSTVLEPDAIREMEDVSQRLNDLPYVEGSIGMHTVVKIFHEAATGNHELPPDNAAGDELIRGYVDASLNQYGDKFHGLILSKDHEAAILIVSMTKGAPIQDYRGWGEELMFVGLEVDDANPHQDATEMRPLSLDMIWLWIEKSTVEEGPLWVGFAALVATLSLYALYRRVPEVLASLVTLGLVMTVTVAAAYAAGIRFNLLSMIMMALVFGLGVDYCMHVTSRFREERALGHPRDEAVSTAVEHVGAALWMSAVTTTVGFASLYFSLIPAIGQFGIMLGAGIFSAYLASILLLPVFLVWIDGRRDEFPELHGDAKEVEARRRELTEELRDKQSDAFMGRLAGWCHDHAPAVLTSTLLILGLLAVPLAADGVEVWTGSYTRPHPVLAEDTYPMETLLKAEEVFGIPVDMSVMIYGDATDPETLQVVKDLEQDLEGVHGRLSTETVLFPLEYYLNLTPEGRSCNCDQDGNGIPDTRADVEAAYAFLRDDPAMNVVMSRVLHDNDDITALRLAINPQGTVLDLGTDIANYREARAETERIVSQYQEENDSTATRELEFANTGLVVLGVEVVDAIVRGNTASIGIMLAVITGLITWFWRRPLLTLVTMVPVLVAILTQYSLTTILGYQVTYVSLIVTGGATGIGVDDGIHFVSRVREEITNDRGVRRAVHLAGSEIGAVLAGTTITDISGFALVILSIVIWGAQTAIIVIPTLIAAFLGTVVVLPAVVRYHASRYPEHYRIPEA